MSKKKSNNSKKEKVNSSRKINKSDISENELLKAMIKVSQDGKGPENQVPSMGCSIKWKK